MSQYVKVRVDEENGCDECWALLRDLLAGATLTESGEDTFVLPRWIYERVKECPHDAPVYAPGILLVVDE